MPNPFVLKKIPLRADYFPLPIPNTWMGCSDEPSVEVHGPDRRNSRRPTATEGVRSLERAGYLAGEPQSLMVQISGVLGGSIES